MIGLMVPSAFAAPNLQNLVLISEESIIIESSDANILRTTLYATNNGNEEISGFSMNFYLNSNGAVYNNDYGWNLDDYGVGRQSCPSIPDIPAGLSKEIILCFVIPKDHLENFSLIVYDSTRDYCGVCEYCTCTSTSTSLKNPNVMNNDDFVSKNLIDIIDDIKLELNSAVLIKQEEFNVLEVSFDATNVSNEPVMYWATQTFAVAPNGMTYPFDNSISKYSNCNISTSRSIDLDPGLTKSYTYCYEVPSDINIFDLSIRNMNSFSDCGSGFTQCKEYVLNISNPNLTSDDETAAVEAAAKQAQAAAEAAAKQAQAAAEAAERVLQEKIETDQFTANMKQKSILSFVDPEKDPSHYVKRYITEETYKDWFNEHFPDYTLYEGIGITQEEYRNIVEELTKPETQPVTEPEPEPEPIPTPTQESSGGGGCLIATAAFGSEMAPQVQFLREIRDNTVMSTQSGTTFMTGFNQFYYSFSPYVADYERENPVFKEAVKVTLTPLLTSLTLLNYVDVDTEEEMLGYGIGIILLNIGMYFVAPAILVISIKNKLKK